jgi:hypothetical protein
MWSLKQFRCFSRCIRGSRINHSENLHALHPQNIFGSKTFCQRESVFEEQRAPYYFICGGLENVVPARVVMPDEGCGRV